MPSWRRRALAAVIGLAIATAACAQARPPRCTAAITDRGCVRVLFIGNSYTFVNNLPGTFVQIAESMGRGVYADMVAPGGATLADHLKSDETMALIRTGHWTYVVLQEQSLMPVTTLSRNTTMYPAARQLVDVIRKTGAEPVLYQTWGRERGWPEGQIADFATMQDSLTSGYRQLASELGVNVVPVGEAWRIVARERRDIPLWQADGSHPTVQGTLLAAHTFAAVLLRETARARSVTTTVPEYQATVLQRAAARAVGSAR